MPVSQYKRLEQAVAERAASRLGTWQVFARNALDRSVALGKRRFTIMLIPHSVRKISTIEVSFFLFLFASLLLAIVAAGSAALAAGLPRIVDLNRRLLHERNQSGAALTILKDEIASLRSSGRRFKDRMDSVLAAADSRDRPLAGPALVGSSLLPRDMPAAEGAPDLAELRTIVGLLDRSRGSLDRTARMVAAFQDLMAATPTTWPLKGGHGIITTRFGWTTNPFTRQGYMHTGVDIAWALGTPIVATADGTILQVARTADLGNFVAIQHKYGYSTRYSHLDASADRHPGDRVSRGEVIGYLGTTGLSTGPHLDYVVRLGSSYINPMQFLGIRPENAPTLAADLAAGE